MVRAVLRLAVGGAVLWAILAGADPQVRAEGFGPFSVRNFQPFQLLVLGMPGDRAAVVKQGTLDIRVELAETASIFDSNTPPVNTVVKFEQLRSGLFLRYGLTDRMEVGLEVPALYRWRGFGDGAIRAVEGITSGVNPARKRLQNTPYAFNVTKDGRPLFSGAEGALGLGDITLSTKYQIVTESERRPAISLRGALKVPSGAAGRFFGSGHPDVGVGVALEKKLGARWIVYQNLNGIVPTGTIAGLALQPGLSSITAIEYLWSPALSLTAQFDYYSSFYRDTGTPVLDRGVTEITAGFSYRLRPNVIWQVYGVENVDLITGSAADFTLATVVTYRFGP
ncbi:DUF3187 family protein [Nitrospira sp. Kam-Ns4a]